MRWAEDGAGAGGEGRGGGGTTEEGRVGKEKGARGLTPSISFCFLLGEEKAKAYVNGTGPLLLRLSAYNKL
jgi:hypothetical protein